MWQCGLSVNIMKAEHTLATKSCVNATLTWRLRLHGGAQQTVTNSNDDSSTLVGLAELSCQRRRHLSHQGSMMAPRQQFLKLQKTSSTRLDTACDMISKTNAQSVVGGDETNNSIQLFVSGQL
jgi:hypothetical protein